MPATWEDVFNKDQYKNLPSRDKELAKVQYFNEVVRPNLDEEDIPKARNQFFLYTSDLEQKKPSIIKDVGWKTLTDIGESLAPLTELPSFYKAPINVLTRTAKGENPFRVIGEEAFVKPAVNVLKAVGAIGKPFAIPLMISKGMAKSETGLDEAGKFLRDEETTGVVENVIGKEKYKKIPQFWQGVIEGTENVIYDPLLIAGGLGSVGKGISKLVPKDFSKYVSKEMSSDLARLEKAKTLWDARTERLYWKEKDTLRTLEKQLEKDRTGGVIYTPPGEPNIVKKPITRNIGRTTEMTPLELESIGSTLIPERRTAISRETLEPVKLGVGGKVVGAPLFDEPIIGSTRMTGKSTGTIIQTLGDEAGSKVLATKDKVDSGMRTGNDLLEHNKMLRGLETEPQLGVAPEVGKPAPISRYDLGIKDIRDQVISGEPGKRTVNAQGEPITFPSSYPSFMADKGWTQKEVLSSIDKGLEGKPLGVRQQAIFDAVKTEAKNQFTEQIGVIRKGEREVNSYFEAKAKPTGKGGKIGEAKQLEVYPGDYVKFKTSGGVEGYGDVSKAWVDNGVINIIPDGTKNPISMKPENIIGIEKRGRLGEREIAKAKPTGEGGVNLYGGILPISTQELEKLIKNTVALADKYGKKVNDYLRENGFNEEKIALFMKNMAVVAKKELQETSKKEGSLFASPIHPIDKKLPSEMSGTEILNYDSPVHKDAKGNIDISGLKKVVRSQLEALGLMDDPALRVLNDEKLGELLEPFRKPLWVGKQFEDVVPQALQIVNAQVGAENRRYVLAKNLTDLAKGYLEGNTLSRGKVNKALHWGEKNFTEIIPDDVLQKKFGLIPQEIEMYKSFRDSVNTSWDHKINLMKEAEPVATDVKAWARWNEGYQGLLEQRIPGYVPHEWYGKFNVVRYNEAGEVIKIDSFPNRYKARRAIQQIGTKDPMFPVLMRREEIPEGMYSGINADWTESMIRKSALKAGLDEEQVSDILRSFDLDMKSRGWSKHLIHRKGVGGYEEDLRNPLLDYLNGYAGSVSKAEKAVEFRKLFTEIPHSGSGSVRGLKDYMKDTIDYYLLPDSDVVNRKIKDVLFNFFLGGRIKQIPIQASQQLVSYVPMLSTITKGPNIKLNKSAIDLLKGSLSEDDRLAFTLVNKKYPEQMGAELTRELSGRKGYPGYDTIRSGADMVRAGLRWPIEFGEQVINRKPAFLTSYRVFRAKGLGVEEAVDKSMDMINTTHYLYAKANRAPIERGNFQTALTFRSFTMNYMEEMAYLARHKEFGAIARSMAAMTALAGAVGLPFAELGVMAYKRYFGESPETALRKLSKQEGGKGIAGKVGLTAYESLPSSFLNIDVKSSIGVGDILFGDMDRVFEDPRRLITEVPKTIIGAPAGFVARMATGAYELGRGNVRKGVEQLSPEVLRDPQIAYRMMTEGATTKEGHPIETEPGKTFKYTPFEAVKKGIGGLQSARYTRLMNERQEIKDLIGDTNKMQDYFAHQLLRARDAKDRATWEKLRGKMAEVNKDRSGLKMPPIVVTEEMLQNRKEADKVPLKWRGIERDLQQAYK